jgi:hypothetical protein
MDWTAVNARLIAFASPGVVDALVDAMEAQHDFEAKLARFAFVKEMGRVPGHPFFPGTGSQRDAATKALTEATRLAEVLMDTIRAELHASTDRVPEPPVPLASPALDNPE